MSEFCLKWATKKIQTVNFIILKSKKLQRGTVVAVVGILSKLKQLSIDVTKTKLNTFDTIM